MENIEQEKEGHKTPIEVFGEGGSACKVLKLYIGSASRRGNYECTRWLGFGGGGSGWEKITNV